MTMIWAAGFFAIFAFLVHFTSILIAIGRCRQPKQALPAAPAAPPVSIVRPVCGIENCLEETLASGFALAYPRYELVFCVDDPDDPVVPLVRRLIDAHPNVPARLLIGREAISNNPKLNNVLKGWREAAHDWVVIADSNVLMPSDYVQRLLAAWREDTGLVCSPPVGTRGDGFWAQVENAFLNTYQARWQYAADTVGYGFAQGKTMLWRKADLERAGGIRRLAAEIAEDAASTKVVRGLGLRVRLVDAPFAQPLGRRKARDVWHRQVRWAQLRRASFKQFFAPEILTSGAAPLAAAVFVGIEVGHPFALVGALALAWYAGEIALARAVGWQLTPYSPLAFLARDLLMPLVWLNGWFGAKYVWRGNAVQTAESLDRYKEYRVVRSFARMTNALARRTNQRWRTSPRNWLG